MKRRHLLLGVAAFVASRAAARPPYRVIAAGEVLRGRFAQERQLKGFTHPLASSGDFVLVPGRGLIWRTLQPFAIVTVITATGLVQQVNGTETTRLTATQLPFLARVYGLLSSALDGDWHALDAEFQATEHSDAKQWELDLVPRAGGDSQSMPFRAITLRGGRFLDEVRISGRDDASDRLVFSGQALGNSLSDAESALLRQVGQ